MRHVWIQDRIDWEEVNKFYSDIVVRWRGNKVINLTGYYKGQRVIVYFYDKYLSDRHLQYSLWCGIQIQKVVCFEDIRYDSAMYLLTRLRSLELSFVAHDYVPADVSFIMELCRTEGLVLHDIETKFTYRDSCNKGLPEDLYEFL